MSLTNMNYDQLISYFKRIFTDDNSVVFRELVLKDEGRTRCCLIYINGLVDSSFISTHIVKPLAEADPLSTPFHEHEVLSLITAAGAKSLRSPEAAVDQILTGNTALVLGTMEEILIVDTFGAEKRSIQEPSTEKNVRGPKEGFTESLIVNMSMIRRRIRSPELKFEYKVLGSVSSKSICICYIKDIASPKIVRELMNRLEKINLDAVLDSGVLQESLKDSSFSPFKTIGGTEKPDAVAGKLLEGRVVLLCDGSPMALTVPFIFTEYFQVSEDYYNFFVFASLNRMLRLLGFFLATSVAPIYVALITFHQEMIPTTLVIGITAARQGVPFPTIVEALLLLVMFEILREVGIRIPSEIGQTISFVGALIIGQAAVEAKFISAPMVIVAAIAGITGFLVAQMDAELLVIRYTFLIASSIIGLFGYLFCIIILFIHLSSLRSFGIPYLMSVASPMKQDQKDMLIRAPWKFLKKPTKLMRPGRHPNKAGE